MHVKTRQSCLFVTPAAVYHWTSLTTGFSKQEYWSEVPTLLQRIFLTQGLKLCLLHLLAGEFFNTSIT